MRVSMLVRSTLSLLGLAIMAGCSDVAVEPTGNRSLSAERTVAPTLRRDGASVPVLDLKNGKVQFTIDPRHAQNVSLGNHTISFPAYSICDPATSSYGEAYWDAPCRPASQPITFTAEWNERSNHALIEFEPSVRFVPSWPWDIDRWVVLSLKERQRLEYEDNAYAILWRGPRGWVDESRTDPTLKAWVDRGGNRVSRRIKHFSGYNVTAGFAGCSGYGGDSYCSGDSFSDY